MGSPKESHGLVGKFYTGPILTLFFVSAFVHTDSLQEIRVELAPVRAVEAAQVAVCTRKTMMMTCMAKWWWPACSELAWLDLVP